MSSKKVAFCFDGAVARQCRYESVDVIDAEAVSGINALFKRLYVSGYEIEIFSARCREYSGYKAVMHWLVAHSLLEYVSSVIQYASDANVIIDARCVTGRDIPSLLAKIEAKENNYEEN